MTSTFTAGPNWSSPTNTKNAEVADGSAINGIGDVKSVRPIHVGPVLSTDDTLAVMFIQRSMIYKLGRINTSPSNINRNTLIIHKKHPDSRESNNQGEKSRKSDDGIKKT